MTVNTHKTYIYVVAVVSAMLASTTVFADDHADLGVGLTEMMAPSEPAMAIQQETQKLTERSKSMTEKKVYWIDVRTAEEFAGGHHPEAVNIPYETISEHIASVTEDKDADIRMYCRSGRRSGFAMETVQALGYTDVTNEGGYDDVQKLLAK